MRVGLGVALILLAASAGCTKTVQPTAAPTPTASAPLSAAEAVRDVGTLPGVVHEEIAERSHVDGPVTYDHTPPIGGNHNVTWADCTGTVYTQEIAKENAVHSLEHGAVWVTYQPDLPKDQVAALAGLVDGHNYTLMSPYPGQPKAVSLQAWGWQLALDRADLDLARRFIRDLAQNPVNTPEPGATCINDRYKADPSPPLK
jgi:uncharacterized protein DUF3105